MAETPAGKCGYTWLSWLEAFGFEALQMHQNCCWREALPDTDRCAWHADPDDTDEKTIEALRDARVDADERGQASPVGELLDGAILRGLELDDAPALDRVSLRDADLSDARLIDADLSDANLSRADLSDANLSDADLSDANLSRADLSDAKLSRADLSDANLSDADLSDARLIDTDLSNANLQKSTLLGINPNNATFEEVSLDSRTRVSPLLGSGFSSVVFDWHGVSQGYERLRKEFRREGLEAQQREIYTYQRRARAKEALLSLRPVMWFSNLLSRWLTGYGVKVGRVLLWTLLVIAIPWLWYGRVEGWADTQLEGGPMYYSIVTFVTSPPHPPPELSGTRGQLTQFITLAQTYLGTALIILLGYVLGNRDPL